MPTKETILKAVGTYGSIGAAAEVLGITRADVAAVLRESGTRASVPAVPYQSSRGVTQQPIPPPTKKRDPQKPNRRGRKIQHNMVGEPYGWLKVIALTTKRQAGHVVYLCRCKCGTEIEVARPNLKNGSVVSCGCGRSDPDRAKRRAATLGNQKVQEIARGASAKAAKLRRDESLQKLRREIFHK